MADTKRTLSDLQLLFADNTTRNISAQDLRDFLVSVLGSRNVSSYSVDTALTTNNDIVLVDATAALRTITLPSASSNNGKTFSVKKIDSSVNPVKLTGDTIDGESSFFLLIKNQSVEIASNGTEWKIVQGGYRNSSVKIFEQTATASLPASPDDTSIFAGGEGVLTVPAGWFTVGSSIRIEAFGESVNSANSFDLQMHTRVGSVTVDSDLLANSELWANGLLVKITVDIVCRSVGGSGNFQVKGKFEIVNDTTSVILDTHDATNTVIDTTIANLLDVSIETVTSNFDSLDITNVRIFASK